MYDSWHCSPGDLETIDKIAALCPQINGELINKSISARNSTVQSGSSDTVSLYTISKSLTCNETRWIIKIGERQFTLSMSTK